VEEGPAPEDLKAWWPENGGPATPPANPWHAVPCAPRVVDPHDWPHVRSEVHSVVRMSETVVDTLACQLRQDEQAARLFAKHLAEVDIELRQLAQRLHVNAPDGEEPASAIAALEGYADAVRRLETGMQSVFRDLQHMQASLAAPGVSAILAEQSATLRDLQGTLAAVSADLVQIGAASLPQTR
jgi:hypothetical protein